VLVSQSVQVEPAVVQSAPLTQAQMPAVELSPATLPSPTLDTRPGAPLKLVANAAGAAAKPAAVASASASGFYLQAGAFADPANAAALRGKLAAYGRVDVVATEAGGRTLSRVMAGPFAARADAEAVQARMADAGAKSIVIARGE
jgi:cell division protein FtsN